MSILFVNKPKGITSFDVCYKLRKVLNTKHIGHTGTLDPNASGVMILCSDKDTKTIQFLKADTKEYIGVCKLGIKTDTLDIDGKVLEQRKCSVNKDDLINTFKSFLGKSKQKPPKYSAIRHNGKKLYELARQNIEVEIKERDIEVFNLELIEFSDMEFSFKCKVSSGTYIRVLLEDILNKLGVIGTLSDLKRIKCGSVSLDECELLDDILDGKYKFYNSYDLLKNIMNTYEIKDIKPIYDGKPIKLDIDSDIVLITNNNKAIAVYKKSGEVYTCIRGLF